MLREIWHGGEDERDLRRKRAQRWRWGARMERERWAYVKMGSMMMRGVMDDEEMAPGRRMMVERFCV